MLKSIARLLCAFCFIFASMTRADHTIANGPAVADHLFPAAEDLKNAQQHELFGPVLTKVANNIALDNYEYILFCAVSMARTPDIEQFLTLTTYNIDDLLAFALQAGNLPAFKHLLQCGANPYHKEHLATACETGHIANADKGPVEVTSEDIIVIDCLTYAAKNRQPQFVLACLEHTADPTVDIVEIALECLALLPCDATTHTALKNWIAQALRNNPSLLHTHYGHGGTLLCLCAEYGDVELCKLALELGADPNLMTKEVNNIYATPLVAASQVNSEQHHACIQLLLQYGANPNLHKQDQMLPLSVAGQNDDSIAFELLFPKSSLATKNVTIIQALLALRSKINEGNIVKKLPIMFVETSPLLMEPMELDATIYSILGQAYQTERQAIPNEDRDSFFIQKYAESQLKLIEIMLDESCIPLTFWAITGYALHTNPKAFTWNTGRTEPNYEHIAPLLLVAPQPLLQFFLDEKGVPTIQPSAQAIKNEYNLQNNIIQACRQAIAAKANDVNDLFSYLSAYSEAEEEIVTYAIIGICGFYAHLTNKTSRSLMAALQ
jgi:hypothetical protein